MTGCLGAILKTSWNIVRGRLPLSRHIEMLELLLNALFSSLERFPHVVYYNPLGTIGRGFLKPSGVIYVGFWPRERESVVMYEGVCPRGREPGGTFEDSGLESGSLA